MKRRKQKPVRRRGMTRGQILALITLALEETNRRLTRIETRYAHLESVLAFLEGAAKESGGRLKTAVGQLETVTKHQCEFLAQVKRNLG